MLSDDFRSSSTENADSPFRNGTPDPIAANGRPHANAIESDRQRAAQDMRRFLQIVRDPAPDACHEIRILEAQESRSGAIAKARQYGKTFSGWFDDGKKFGQALKRVGDVSVYITINPVKLDLMARADNRLCPIKNNTSDGDILRLRWVFVDVDAIRPAGISATDAELAKALVLRDRILGDDDIKASSIWGCSGNGGWILVRIADLENTKANAESIHAFLIRLAAIYKADGAGVDVATFNPARIMGLVGRLKCKGEDFRKGDPAIDRPWRYSTLDSPDPGENGLAFFDIAAWLEKHPAPVGPAASAPAPSPASKPKSSAANRSGASVVERAIAYLATCEPAIQGDHGSDKTFGVAARVGCGFDLSEAETVNLLLREYNPRCDPPWTQGEIEKKVRDAFKNETKRGWLLNKPPESNGRKLRVDRPSAANNGEAIPESRGDPAPNLEQVNKAADDPHRLSRLYAATREVIRFWSGEFYEWSPPDSCYRTVPAGDIKGRLTESIEAEFNRLNVLESEAHERLCASLPPDQEKPKPPICRRVTRRLVDDATNALQSITRLEISRCSTMPCWLVDPPSSEWTASNTLVCANGLLNLDTLELQGSTPGYFAVGASPARWNPNAPEPTRFFEFLGELWPDDPESVILLQQWFGLSLTSETRFQKMLALIGAKRSGKGTIARLLAFLLGEGNVAGPKLASFANQFGLAPLIGKTLAIVSEMRLTAKLDSGQIVENLLSISGEDAMTIDRKHRDPWTGRLSTRIMVMSNELPKLADASAALASRFLYLRLRRSFAGREDLELEAKLQSEADGILLWAVKGWQDLKEHGRFRQPSAGESLAAEMAALSSPAHEFACDCLEFGPRYREITSVVFERWKKWAEERSLKEGLWTASTFGRKLSAAVPSIEVSKPTTVPGRVGNHRLWIGARLKPETEAEIF